jgi:hypothetical protein
MLKFLTPLALLISLSSTMSAAEQANTNFGRPLSTIDSYGLDLNIEQESLAFINIIGGLSDAGAAAQLGLTILQEFGEADMSHHELNELVQLWKTTRVVVLANIATDIETATALISARIDADCTSPHVSTECIDAINDRIVFARNVTVILSSVASLDDQKTLFDAVDN